MLSILANGVLFFHTHELENGKIITHAHPILTEEQEELPDHGHTEMELITLDLIANADYLVFDFSILPIPVLITEDHLIFFGAYSNPSLNSISLGFDHRGPPALA
jgi:hypothetical protein